MKKFAAISILFIFYITQLHSQDTLYVSKNEGDIDTRLQVTLNGNLSGKISRSEIMNATKLSISQAIVVDNCFEIEIKEYAIFIFHDTISYENGMSYFEQVFGSQITLNIRKQLLELKPGDKIYINGVKGKCKTGEDVFLRGLNFTISD